MFFSTYHISELITVSCSWFARCYSRTLLDDHRRNKCHKERSSEQGDIYNPSLLLNLNTATISFFQLYITRYRLCILNTFQATLGSGRCQMPAPMLISAHTKPSIGKEKRDVITKAMNHQVKVRINTKPIKI